MDCERNCLSDHIRKALAQRIIDGSLKPGERLVELKIAREFNSSQTPVREALRELESLRLIESLPYRGTRVREVSEREMAEAYAVRAALERLAAESAVTVLKGKAVALRQSVANLLAAARAGDREGYASHDLDLHRAIVSASGNRTLLAIWESLAFETKTRLSLARRQLDLVTLAAWHETVIDALEAGDGETAGRLLKDHAESFMSPLPNTGLPEIVADPVASSGEETTKKAFS
ncbi:MAG TPA: GntR family transcriptional regulator [Isosphaeraceae bacterium]|jgi:DNA-binding GntR family transcriptional regulator|nr:GntR family transcriptional regulator [Isosphaeraceae bacterium]